MKRGPRQGKSIAWVALGWFAMAATSLGQYQVTLGGNVNLDGGAALGSIANSGGNGTRTSPWLYAFTSGGLDCGVNRVYSTIDVDDRFGTSFKLDMGGYGVTGTSGNVSFSTVSTAGWLGAGSVSLVNVGAVDLGGVDTHTTSGNSRPGDIAVGQSGSPAGPVRVDYLYGYAGGDLAGQVTIYGLADVLIRTASGVEGDLNVNGVMAASAWQVVNVRHDGAFVTRDILFRVLTTQWDIPSGWGGHVTLDGGTKSGAAIIRDIDGRFNSTGSGTGNGLNGCGNVIVRNYASVALRNVNMSYVGKGNVGAGGGGGDVTITNIAGDITVTGTIDLSSTHATADPDAVPGILKLACGGTITLAELTLDKMKSASLSSSGKVQVLGRLTGFPTGTPADGTLDCPAGQKIFYRPQMAENVYLGGRSYTLKSGGGLRSAPSGTVVFFK